MVKHLLILGGTGDARQLARRVSLMIGKRVRVTTSLAGRRGTPPNLAGDVRTGGFGGVQGMMAYLAENAVDLVVDATHPFSPTISDHATTACGDAGDGGIPRLQLMRGVEQLSQVLTDDDSRQLLSDATEAFVEGEFYRGLKRLRGLLPREERLLAAQPRLS